MSIAQRLGRPAAGYLIAIALVALMTGIVALFRLAADVANVSMLYLLVVIACAVAFGRGPAIVAAFASFLAFNFFFVQPHHTFTVADEEEWVALVLLLITGIITGQLAALLRERARDARRREREAVALYDVVRLVTDPDFERALTAVAERLRAELDLAVVLITVERRTPVRAQADMGDGEAISLAVRAEALPKMILGTGEAPTPAASATPGRWIRVVDPKARTSGQRAPSGRVRTVPVDSGGARLGSITLVRRTGTPDFSASDDRLLSGVAHQLALALERLRLQEEATEAEVLRRTDELRAALINAVSHDLRTPLSSIIASAESLLQIEITWTDEERAGFAGVIATEARRLNGIVGNLLDLGRIESGSIQPEKGWYDLASLLSEVAGRLLPSASEHRIVLEVPEDVPPLLFDYVEIDQVVTNLLENALKHTPAGSVVQLSVSVRKAAVEVAVSDNGPGLRPDAFAQLFKPFYRLTGDRAASGGAGLGLAVARGLVEAHGGRIWAENLTGGGARLAFNLPMTEQPVAAA